MPVEVSQSWAGPYHRMPLELPKDRAAMIAKAIEADDGACSTGAMMADPAPVAAKPLLDELAEVARRAWYASDSTTPGMIRDWDKVPAHHQEWWRAAALAVARRLLEREPSEAEVTSALTAWFTSDDYRGGMREALKASRRAQLAELETTSKELEKQ